jgi:hypothetical protein
VTAEIRRRKQRDLELAQKRYQPIEPHQQQMAPLSDKIGNIAVTPVATATKDPERLLSKTAASRANALAKDQLDVAEYKRSNSSAHSRPIAMSGRDLGMGVRSRPSWAAHMM